MGIKRRKTNPSKRSLAQISQDEPSTLAEAFESRISRIERRLDSANGSDPQASRRTESWPQPTSFEPHDSSPEAIDIDRSNRRDFEGFHLPEREDVLYYVECYFRHLNNAMPLFDRNSFMEVFDAWFANSDSRTSVKWAAIQTVLALGVRASRFETVRRANPPPTKRTNSYLANAQSVLPDLVTQDDDLLGLQTLLGIVILLQNRSDQKPGSAILASAMRLAHRLELHSGSPDRRLSSSEALQRCRVFWVAYMLDKETSLRVKTPSMQLDDDVDIALPPFVSSDGIGLLSTADGQSVLSYFRLRVELAYIHGIIYDLLYSARAFRVDDQERNRRTALIQSRLNKWYEHVPTVFQMDHLASVVGPVELVQVTRMHHSFLIAKVMAHGFYSRDAEWIKGTSSPHTITLDDILLTQESFGAMRGNTKQMPPSQQGWEELVYISRGCMKLFHATSQIESLIWQCSCGHSSALMILLANIFLNPDHPFVELDRHLCNKSIELFEETVKTTNDKAFVAVRKIVIELARMADEASRLSTIPSKHHSSDQDLATRDAGFLEPQDWNFGSFEDSTWTSFDDFGVSELDQALYPHR